MRSMARIDDLLLLLKWTQPQMAAFLRVDQSAVSRMSRGQPESGPVSRLLDQLSAGAGLGLVTAGMSPDDVLARLSPPETMPENAA